MNKNLVWNVEYLKSWNILKYKGVFCDYKSEFEIDKIEVVILGIEFNLNGKVGLMLKQFVKLRELKIFYGINYLIYLNTFLENSYIWSEMIFDFEV